MSSPVDREFCTDLDRARSGELAATDRLLAILQDQLPSEAARQLGPGLRGKTRASDLAQDAFVEILQRLPEFRGRTVSSFRGWAGRILLNAMRQQHRHLVAAKRKAPSRTSQLEQLARILIPPERSAASEVIALERLELLERAMGTLTPDQRHAIEACLISGRPAADVADEMNRSVGAVHMLTNRARAALLLAVERLEADGDPR